MKNLFLLSIIFLSPNFLFAKSGGENSGFSSKRNAGPFAGFGFGYEGFDLKLDNSTKSTFRGWYSAAEGGFNVNMSDSFGFVLSAEYKMAEGSNTIDSATYMEKASIKALTGKLGFYLGALVVGGGYSDSQIEVKNVSSQSSSQTTTFKGNPAMVFANYGFENGALRATLEAQYSSGKLETMELNEYAVGVRLYFLFGD